MLRSKKLWVIVLICLPAIVYHSCSWNQHTVDFNTEVKPILNKKCISCHGGVKRKGGFSLLFRQDALAPTESGKPAIIPGKPRESEMIRRLTLNDPEDRMPYKHDPLSQEEINTLTKWIDQGAAWGDHWAYVPLKPVDVPSLDDAWITNDIDRFILEKLKAEKLKPSPMADKATLLRRVSLDLTGMPAPDHIANAYLKDSSATAYEILVDSLLASPSYGERWTALWLDLARYADTKGYERDDSRSIWRYRDWLIKAFNADMPYDQFITRQIAGDLLPQPTDDDYIATAFHRNTMTNDEGGTDNEEFRTAAIIDRVNTTWEVMLGTTFGCVQCHSHPYDPFRNDEYYKFMAFFNNSRDEDTHADYPLLRHINDSMKRELDEVVNWVRQQSGDQQAADIKQFVKTWQPAVNSILADQFINSELDDTKWLTFRNNAVCRLKSIQLSGKDELVFRAAVYLPNGKWQIHIDKPDGPVIARIDLPASKGMEIRNVSIVPTEGVHDLFFTYQNPSLKHPEDNGILFDWFWFTRSFPGKGKPGYEKHVSAFWSLVKANVPSTPVMMDNPSDMKRPTYVFERGNWLVKGEKVEADVPHSLNPLPAQAPKNRWGLAQWLIDKKNPLTARTMVNRIWEQLYGQGLAETLEDLGTQGLPPTHRELLDWLSGQFMNENKWSIKKTLKLMVMSSVYRQQSVVEKALLEKDPSNKLYARGPRVRLSAEQVRDQGLAVSGLISHKMYGPSVFPHQPKGIWLSPWNGAEWVLSNGSDRFRRALYTYWKRTAPYPSMMTFDGAAREVCTSRRIRTNTPLQALVTLNDEAYLEMSRGLAYRMMKEGGNSIAGKISKGYQWILYKPISAEKSVILERLYSQSLSAFRKDKDRTCEMIGIMNEHNNPETAALVVVANALLNLDEVIVKQ